LEARAAARLHDSTSARLTHDSATALLAETQRRVRDEKSKASLDQRIDNQRRLSTTYAGWIGVLRVQQEALLNRMLRSTVLILLILLGATLVRRWIDHAIARKALDGRRIQTLFIVTRVSVQVLAALLILLVLIGKPDNLGTFLGLAGAGLTVALKDFIISFIGWFVLMGSNGVRIGDLVEINGVTGEVVELGVFQTELLETGGWTESGHPTGRRVTFTNAFAVEGHYFNFSTSGRWLWDEVRITVPVGKDPYPIAESLRKTAEEETATSAREAQEQMKKSRNLPTSAAPAAEASINLKPVPGGVEITVRYMTRTTEREALRSKLYHVAVDLLGGTATTMATGA
jgi:small-conductance mechanosensitive channel